MLPFFPQDDATGFLIIFFNQLRSLCIPYNIGLQLLFLGTFSPPKDFVKKTKNKIFQLFFKWCIHLKTKNKVFQVVGC